MQFVKIHYDLHNYYIHIYCIVRFRANTYLYIYIYVYNNCSYCTNSIQTGAARSSAKYKLLIKFLPALIDPILM